MQRRILVVMVTTRAAATSLRPGDGQVRTAVERGIALLDGMADDVERGGGPETREQLAQARRDRALLLDDASS